MKRIAIILAVVAVAAAGGLYAASPIFAVNALRDAARTGDRAKLEQLVDFPQVREGLKAQLKAKLMSEFARRPKPEADNPFAALALTLAPTLINRMVDNFVTADAVAAMVKTGQAEAAPTLDAPAEAQPAPPAKEKPKTKTRYGYRDLNTFTVASDDPDANLVMTLSRQGPFRWRLTRIDLPLGGR